MSTNDDFIPYSRIILVFHFKTARKEIAPITNNTIMTVLTSKSVLYIRLNEQTENSATTLKESEEESDWIGGGGVISR